MFHNVWGEILLSNGSFHLLSQASLSSSRDYEGYMYKTEVITLLISHWLYIVLVRMRGTAENGTGTQRGLCLPKMGISVIEGLTLHIYLFLCCWANWFRDKEGLENGSSVRCDPHWGGIWARLCCSALWSSFRVAHWELISFTDHSVLLCWDPARGRWKEFLCEHQGFSAPLSSSSCLLGFETGTPLVWPTSPSSQPMWA